MLQPFRQSQSQGMDAHFWQDRIVQTDSYRPALAFANALSGCETTAPGITRFLRLRQSLCILVNPAINVLVAQNCLHIIPCLRKRNRFYKLIDPVIRPCRLPVRDSIVASVISRQCILRHAPQTSPASPANIASPAGYSSADPATDAFQSGPIPSSRAICFPTEGSNCISP